MITIEKNIPLPKIKYKSGEKKYPFGKMKVGDSISAKCDRTIIYHTAYIWSERNKQGKWKWAVREEKKWFTNLEG